MSGSLHERKWWKEAIVYQVHPSTFCDSNGDGIGDIPGILTKLDHIKSLGIDVIWLSLHYRSPQIDMGYDISDFEDIQKPCGALEDCHRLIDETHARVKEQQDNPKREWYFWRPPKFDEHGNRQPPNNWRSQFSVPAWTYDPQTEEYYLHIYAPEMPDLNWETPDTRQAIYTTSMKFWLDRGLDGFRIDTVNKYSKDIVLPDAAISDPSCVTQPAVPHYSNGPRMHYFLSEMHAVFSQYRTFDGQEIMTVGELPNTPLESDVFSYVSAARKQLNMVFKFDAVSLGQKPGDRLIPVPFKNADFIQQMSRWQEFISKKDNADAWTTVFLESHDQGRSISRFGSDESEELRVRSGKTLAIILASMSGTLFLYQGQEIGMVNIPVEWGLEEYKDIRRQNFIAGLQARGAGEQELNAALAGMQKVARDNARLPMPWDGSHGAGFCALHAKPWMRVHPNHTHLNVETEQDDPDSGMNFWKEMLSLRKNHPDLFVYGNFRSRGMSNDPRHDPDGDLFVFDKATGASGDEVLASVVANLSKKPLQWNPGHAGVHFGTSKGGDRLGKSEFERVACNVADPQCDINEQKDDLLLPFEARLYMKRR